MSTQRAQAPQTKTVEPTDDLLARVIEETERIQATADKCSIGALVDEKDMVAAVRRAFGIKQLRRFMHDDFVDVVLMPLMNSRLGFLTDRDPSRPAKTTREPYGRDVVRDCAIEALINGARFTGNEWNIIGGNCYLTQAFYKRKLAEAPGVTDVVYSPGVPEMNSPPGVARLTYSVSWKQNGTPKRIVSADGKPVVFCVKIDQYATIDAVIGKATRDAAKMAYEQAIGSKASAEDPPIDSAEPEPEHATPPTAEVITPAEVAELAAKCRFARLEGNALATALRTIAGVTTLDTLTPPGALAFHRWIDQQVAGK